jgi:putative flippase GtrA
VVRGVTDRRNRARDDRHNEFRTESGDSAGTLLVNLLSDEHSQADSTGGHPVVLEPVTASTMRTSTRDWTMAAPSIPHPYPITLPDMPRILRFAIAGSIATCTHLSIAWLVFNRYIADSAMANLAGFVVANFVSFLLQTLWSFSSRPTLVNFSRFSIVSATGFGISVLVPLLIGRQHLWAPTLMVVCCIPVSSYIVHTHWTYRAEG